MGGYGALGWGGYGSQAYSYSPFMYGYGGSYYPYAYGNTVSAYGQASAFARNAVVDIRCYAFMPANITVTVGGSVTWQNMDPYAHTATSDQGLWDAGDIAPGASSQSVVFATPGVFPYHCRYHPSMHGTITVR
jgi:plastocyanin